MIDLHSPEGRDALAGEYVLGTLSAQDQAEFAAALAGDRPLQAAVYAWQDRLLALSARAGAAVPPPQLWQRIDVALDAITPRARPGTAPAAKRTTEAPPWWQRLSWWRGVSAAALAATLALGVALAVLLGQRPGQGSAVRYVAVLQSPDGRSEGWVVELHADRLRLVPTADGMAPAPSGRSLQFWTKPLAAAGPTSLGLVRAGQVLEMPLSRLPAAEGQQLFEITLEPEGGSTIGRPTGPILFVGRTVALPPT